MTFKYGDVLRWAPNPRPFDDEPIGRFMFVGPAKSIRDPNYETILCLVAAPGTEWSVGDVVPVNVRAEMELAE